MATKAQMMREMEGWRICRDNLEEDLQDANDRIQRLSADNAELIIRVGKLERAVVQKCLDELK